MHCKVIGAKFSLIQIESYDDGAEEKVYRKELCEIAIIVQLMARILCTIGSVFNGKINRVLQCAIVDCVTSSIYYDSFDFLIPSRQIDFQRTLLKSTSNEASKVDVPMLTEAVSLYLWDKLLFTCILSKAGMLRKTRSIGFIIRQPVR